MSNEDAPYVQFKGVYVRRDEHGTLHVDGPVRVENCWLEDDSDQLVPWICAHAPGGRCPMEGGERIVTER